MASRRQAVASCAFGLLMLALACNADLTDDFYALSCPNVTTIVRDLVTTQVAADVGIAAGLLRLHFHDCFVMGCDGSVLLNATSTLEESERDSPPNANSLRGFEQVDEIKAALEQQCPGMVSCADILALAARDATELTGGPTWPVPLGRRDGYISSSEEAQKKLPPSDGSFIDLVRNFANVGLDALDMVILSGAHTLGRGRCVKVWDRLYNFTGVPDLTDPSMDPTFADDLKVKCPKDNTGTFIMMDTTDGVFDNVYYQDVGSKRGLFESDSALLENPIGSNLVTSISTNQSSFFDAFALSMVKMGKIDLKLGTQGEVRRKCAVTNPSRHPRAFSA
ncbi:peroxidase [Marchantia polymorpha subsp. ruderalis]|uniref:Peroxidase n=2 Tax=Marchantia polymorpha TaxID=3197 RepID=A0A176VUG6_MARPO|nr:hypothetical protein AXG93_1615s1030 [Marchantia polymorpha subsp. ruderalis]PTQ40626.1 hypothetical protein MARPO_0039s0113 [Marchantia polymorpha]BBN05899.1 hypothetical protein Mp_3g16820 [Marchantia polymorpha subsp. ruderalis]|eukprot:PTQ40626.1 hypothetical protein MARPO_0039s0113 [Marchantia polymorpha]